MQATCLCLPSSQKWQQSWKLETYFVYAYRWQNENWRIRRVIFDSKQRVVFPGGAVAKNLPANAGDTKDSGSIPGSGRSPGVGNGNLLQYSFLGNSLDRGAWLATVHGVTESDTTEQLHNKWLSIHSRLGTAWTMGSWLCFYTIILSCIGWTLILLYALGTQRELSKNRREKRVLEIWTGAIDWNETLGLRVDQRQGCSAYQEGIWDPLQLPFMVWVLGYGSFLLVFSTQEEVKRLKILRSWDFILGQVGVTWITTVPWDEENPLLQTSTKSLSIWDTSHFVVGSIFIHSELQHGQQSGRLTERTRSLQCDDVCDGWHQFQYTQKQIMLQL